MYLLFFRSSSPWLKMRLEVKLKSSDPTMVLRIHQGSSKISVNKLESNIN